MLQAIVIGHLGGDAEIKSKDGREFTTFRVAHTDRWKDESGSIHESTQWVDCIVDGKPNYVPYLKRGTMVYVMGAIKTRVYSSAADRCMKAGITISISRLELIGGKTDPVPGRIVDGNGMVHEVQKYYFSAGLVRTKSEAEVIQVHDTRGRETYNVDRNGFIYPVDTETGATTEENNDPVF